MIAGRRDPIPALGTDQLHPHVVAAYWDGVALSRAGWRIRRLHYVGSTGTGVVSGQTPGHLNVTIGRPLTQPSPPVHDRDGLPGRLAVRVAELGDHDLRFGTSWLDELRMLLGPHAGRPEQVTLCFSPIGGLAGDQPRPAVRAAFWLLCTLTCSYGWVVGDLGEEVAGYGFTAEIPGECSAIFPASMPNDRSAAALLARCLSRLAADDRLLLIRLWVWHLDGCAGRSRPRRLT